MSSANKAAQFDSRSLKELGEFGLIEQLSQLVSASLPAGIVGIGDDCAVIPASCLFGRAEGWLLITTDALVEQKHFRTDFSSFADIGWKSLAVNLSDIAAMGGSPIAAVVALEIRPDLQPQQIRELYQGFNLLSQETKMPIVGGDTVAGSELSLCVTIIGSAAKKPILRSTAQAGDDLWVSGEIGGACAGLMVLEGLRKEGNASQLEEYLRRHRRPEPRISLGQLLLKNDLAHAMIDVSDGLLQDASHIARQSSLEWVIQTSSVPLACGLGGSLLDTLPFLAGGDDYELLFAAPREARTAVAGLSGKELDQGRLPKLTRIGAARPLSSDEPVLLCLQSGEEKAPRELFDLLGQKSKLGYQHF